MKTLIFAVFAALFAMPAWAGQCAPRQVVIEAMQQKYKEQRVAIAISETGLMVEIYAAENGSWTAIQTNGQGLSCVVSSGQAFELIQPKYGEEM